ncbi:unnamed protein product [Linum trigynum]|uniref:Uncharacterized protein n=1 Tax=Linum trigynum TaxID=586398 RepID=A0AAV2E4G0_9ROSI
MRWIGPPISINSCVSLRRIAVSSGPMLGISRTADRRCKSRFARRVEEMRHESERNGEALRRDLEGFMKRMEALFADKGRDGDRRTTDQIATEEKLKGVESAQASPKGEGHAILPTPSSKGSRSGLGARTTSFLSLRWRWIV